MTEKNKSLDITEITQIVSKFIEQNFKAILAGFGVVVVATSLWFLKVSLDRKHEAKAFTELYALTQVYQEKKAQFEPPADPMDKIQTPAKATKATGDLSKDYGDVVDKLEAFLIQNPGTNAAGEAALTLAEVYADYKMPLKGAEALDKTLLQSDKKNILQDIMRMRAGDLYALAEQCEKAVPLWELVANGESFVKDQAQLKLGVCLQQVGQLEQAKQWFSKLADKSPNSTEGFNAKRYLRFLEFKTRNGGLIEKNDSKNVAPTTTPAGKNS